MDVSFIVANSSYNQKTLATANTIYTVIWSFDQFSYTDFDFVVVVVYKDKKVYVSYYTYIDNNNKKLLHIYNM